MQPHTLLPPLRRPTVEEWFLNPFVHILATSESLGWNNILVRRSDLVATPDFSPTPYTEVDTVVLSLTTSTHIEAHIGRRFSRAYIGPGSLMIYPRHCEQMDGRWDSPVSAIFMQLPYQTIVDVAAPILHGDPVRVELLLTLGQYDPFIQHLGMELYRELQNHSLFGPLFAESVGNTMTLALLRKYSNIAVLREVSGGKLRPAQVRIVDEYIQVNLHQKISLADLAACLHLSVPHFEKMFRATFRCPPYRYVLERRIERAKVLLCHTQLPLYEVACDCGFANQSHFTRHFTKFVGVSPARFMRDARN